MFSFPDLPQLPEEHTASGEIPTRYEDIDQEGRVKVGALPHGLGAICWMKLLRRHPINTIARTEGIVPILGRLVLEGGGGPVSVRRWLEGRGGYHLSHTVDQAGAPERLILSLSLEVLGTRGRTHGPPPEGAGEQIRVGRVFAEHVFTRPFAPPGERRVRRLPEVDGLPAVPEARHAWRDGAELLELPQDAEALDPGLVDDPVAIVFGLAHTDSNAHVNSLEYPRLFEEAALRALARWGRPTTELVRYVETSYRKPCFAGDRMRIRLRLFDRGGRPGVVAALVPADHRDATPYCTARLSF